MFESPSEFNENYDAFPDVAHIFNPDEEEPSISLDENGFPFEKPTQEEPQQRAEVIFDENPGRTSKDDTFTADFYRCGTDWSSLTPKQGPPNLDTNKKLKQISLFQMWGINKRQKNSAEKFDVLAKSKDQNHAQSIGLPFGDSGSKASTSWSDSFGGRSKSVGVALSSAQRRKPRPCPFYKKMPGTPFTVDAFRYGAVNRCSAYFLTHFHADHYGGLSKLWSHGHIYCTPITARLVKMCLYVDPQFIFPLELDVEHDIDGVKVTMLEANHCPGAALIHFQLPSGECYLHTGDFRACKRMQTYPLLVNKQVDVLYLDTTYCNSKYRFPSKEEVLSFVVRTTKACIKKQPRTLIIVGAYSIGKECVYMAIAEELKVKIHTNASRRRILQSFGWLHLSKILCSNGKDTPLHVLPISSLRHETLKHYLKTYQDQFSAVVAFRPTGWTFSEAIGSQMDLIKPNSKGNIQIYGVPYSEHSSFTELKKFVQFLKPKKIIATVNISNAASRDKQQSYFRQWLNG